MTDEELDEIRERNRSLDAYLRETLPHPRVPVVDTRLFSGASTATDDITALVAEVERQRAEHALAIQLAADHITEQERQIDALREIARAVAEYDATYCGIELGYECAFGAEVRARRDGWDYGCHWNKGEADRTRYMFIHGQECPVLKARELLAEDTPS